MLSVPRISQSHFKGGGIAIISHDSQMRRQRELLENVNLVCKPADINHQSKFMYRLKHYTRFKPWIWKNLCSLLLWKVVKFKKISISGSKLAEWSWVKLWIEILQAELNSTLGDFLFIVEVLEGVNPNISNILV